MWVLRAACALGLAASPSWANNLESNNFWVVWERSLNASTLCDADHCTNHVYISHFIEGMETPLAQRFFGRLQDLTNTPTHANIRTPQSPLCFQTGTVETRADINPAMLELANKVDTLRGLNGVFVDLRGVRGPQRFDGQFGPRAQKFVETIFAEHDIPILTREEAEAHPGNPTLSLRYSPEVIGCRPWSVSLSLKQRLLLARKTELMIEGTTWSGSAMQSEADADFREDAAMEQVIIAFAEAYVEANSPALSEAPSN